MPFARIQITEEQAQKIIEKTRQKIPPGNAAQPLQAKLNDALSKYEYICEITERPDTKIELQTGITSLQTSLHRVLKILRLEHCEDELDFSVEHPYLFQYLDRVAMIFNFRDPNDPYGNYVLSSVDRIKKFTHIVGLLKENLDLIPEKTRLSIGNTSLSILIGHLLPQVYKDFFNRKWGYSRSSEGGQPYGPGIRFIQAVIEVAEIKTSKEPAAIASHHERYKKNLAKRPKKNLTWQILTDQKN